MKRATHKKFTRTLLASSIAGTLLLALNSSNAVAQEANKAGEKKTQQEQEQNVEVIEVSGVRESLENALNVKRAASSIVDAISASDLDALPALDLGEALQALPGVQLNSDEEGRLSTISLRGLGSGFVLSTAFGQTFAPPAGSDRSVVGNVNPFSTFEGSVFDGVTVVKSPTADLMEGGLAGTVDKKLAQALSKKDGQVRLAIGGRFEEVSGIFDPNFQFSAVKHLIDDKLAVSIKAAGSGQRFRRDTFIVSHYREVSENDRFEAQNNNAAYTQSTTNIAEYRDIHGLSDDTPIFVPVRANNATEFSDGNRYSVAGNIEYKPTENLKLGLHVLSAVRDLDDGTKESSTFGSGLNINNAARDQFNSRITLDTTRAPVAFDTTADGETAFVVNAYDFENGFRSIENRKTTFLQETHSAILYADYVKDDWVADVKVVGSAAKNNFENIGINFISNEDWRPQANFTDASGRRNNLPAVGTGFNGRIDLGDGSAESLVVNGAFDPGNEYVFDGLVWQVPNAASTGVSSISDLNGGRRLTASINGRVIDRTRRLYSFESSVQKYTDFGLGDALRFESVKSGVRFSRDTLDNVDEALGSGGIDTANYSSAYVSNNTIESDGPTFFGGNTPGLFDGASGQWLTIDNNLAISTLQQNIATSVDEITPALSPTDPAINVTRNGFWERADRNLGTPVFAGNNFAADQDILALYLTSDISGEIGSIPFTGNVGVRYVKTMNSFDGVQVESGVDDRNRPRNGVVGNVAFDDDYENVLPMTNIAFELTDDIILRAAYYEGIVRPNLLAQAPAIQARNRNQQVDLILPASTLDPYEAKNYDLSLEWYNREGSAVSLGLFRKTISNLFGEVETPNCPPAGLASRFVGEVEEIETAGEFGVQCQQVVPTVDEDGNEFNNEVNTTISFNIEDTLTVEGLEIAIQQKLDFLPYPWSGFGGNINFTKINQDSDVDPRFIPRNPLNRVSPESFNARLYWQNKKVSIRLTYNWRADQQIIAANNFNGIGLRTREATERLDMAIRYKISKKTRVNFNAFNITDFLGREFQGFNPNAIRRLTYPGRVYQMQVQHTF